MSFENRVAIVTGAARGIGKAIGLELARRGACPVICDVDKDGLDRLGEELAQADKPFLTNVVDVRNRSDIEKMVRNTLKKFGRIDILVNNAGILRPAPVLKIKEEDWDLVMQINLKGTMLCSQAVLKPMMARKFGRIVNMSSLAGRVGGLLVGASYASSKAGILGFTKTLAKEVAAQGITVNAVAPGNIDTALIQNFSGENRKMLIGINPLGRYGTPEEVASLVCFLASEEAGYITGATVDIDGGLSMAS